MKLMCKFCGEAFESARMRMYCSKKCGDRASHARLGGTAPERLERDFRMDRIERRQKKLAMNKRLAERDAAYAEAFPNTARGEKRGRCGFGGGMRAWSQIMEVAHG